MQNFSALVRQAMSGAMKPRAEGDKPEEDMEDDIPVEDDDEGDKPEDEAEDDQPQEDAEGDEPADETEGDGDKPEASGRKAAGSTAFAAGRKAERKRIASIMGNPAADANPSLAAHLAFTGSMDARSAIATLKASAPAASGDQTGTLAGRMAAASQPRLGGSAAASGKPASAPDRILAAATSIIEHKRATR